MERELRVDYSKMSDWVERFIAELEKPDCCSEAELRINWLMFRLMCGNFIRRPIIATILSTIFCCQEIGLKAPADGEAVGEI